MRPENSIRDRTWSKIPERGFFLSEHSPAQTAKRAVVNCYRQGKLMTVLRMLVYLKTTSNPLRKESTYALNIVSVIPRQSEGNHYRGVNGDDRGTSKNRFSSCIAKWKRLFRFLFSYLVIPFIVITALSSDSHSESGVLRFPEFGNFEKRTPGWITGKDHFSVASLRHLSVYWWIAGKARK